MVYAYCRVSTKMQKLQRQIDNIKAAYPEISSSSYYMDSFTGRTMDRPEWNKLYKRLKAGDMVVFDSVSRMSRNAVEGAELYEKM